MSGGVVATLSRQLPGVRRSLTTLISGIWVSEKKKGEQCVLSTSQNYDKGF
jgi:hypothetical protein